MSETNGEEKGPNMRWGLSFTRGRFLWVLDAWYHWIPGQPLIMAIWNNYACWRWGHDDTLWHLADAGYIPKSEADCTNCCKHLEICVGGHPINVSPDFTGGEGPPPTQRPPSKTL